MLGVVFCGIESGYCCWIESVWNLLVLNLIVLWLYAMLTAKQVGILYKPVYTLHYTTAWGRWRGKEPWKEAMTWDVSLNKAKGWAWDGQGTRLRWRQEAGSDVTLAEAGTERRADGRDGEAVRTHRDRRGIHPGVAAAACCQETQLPRAPHIPHSSRRSSQSRKW